MVRSNRELQFRHLVCTHRYVKLLKSYEKLISIKTNRPLEMSHLFLSHIGDAVPAAKLEVLGLFTCIAYTTLHDSRVCCNPGRKGNALLHSVCP